MPKPLVFLPEIPDEIERARDWYDDRAIDAAERFLATLASTLEKIEDNPALGGFHDDRRLYRSRRVPKFPYVVVYREYDDHTLIVAVYHTSRHPDGWRGRLDR